MVGIQFLGDIKKMYLCWEQLWIISY